MPPSQPARGTGDAEWQNYGGHRFWLAPEQMPRTYYPDKTTPSRWKITAVFVRFIAPVETTTRMQKTLDVALDPNAAEVSRDPYVRNHNPWAVELAPWGALSDGAGPHGPFPPPPRGSHQGNLLPTGHLITWAYTNMADPRWTWGEQHVLLRRPECHHAAKNRRQQRGGLVGLCKGRPFLPQNLRAPQPASHLPGPQQFGPNCTPTPPFWSWKALAPLVQLEPDPPPATRKPGSSSTTCPRRRTMRTWVAHFTTENSGVRSDK